MITGIHHFALTVSDMDRSLAFYTGLFGLEVLSDREVQGDYVEKITGISVRETVPDRLHAVADKLGLTAEQRDKIREIHAGFASKYQAQRAARRELPEHDRAAAVAVGRPARTREGRRGR